MAHQAPDQRLSIDEYLAGERTSEVKHEYAAGHVFAMAGASERHNRVCGNLFAHLHAASRKSHCVPFMADMRLRIGEVIYYPDLMVCCDPADDDAYLKRSPCVVIEVLSESTERIDRGEKLHNYRQIPGLKAYVLVSQERPRVEIYRRTDSPQWLFESHDGLDAAFDLPCPPTRVAMAEIYERLEF
jgi:Uma2 family endonuclease